MLGSLLPEECGVLSLVLQPAPPTHTPHTHPPKRNKKSHCYIRVHCRRYASNDGQAWVDARSPSPPQVINNTLSSELGPSRTSSPSLLLEVEELSDEDLKVMAEQLELQKLNQSA